MRDDAASHEPQPAARKKTIDRNTVVRFATAVALIPILLWLMFWAPPIAFQIVLALAIGIAAHELFRMVAKDAPVLQLAGVLSTLAVAMVLTHQPTAPALASLIVVLGAFPALTALLNPEPSEGAGMRAAWVLGGPLYVGALMASIARLHQLDRGGQWVLIAMWIAWSSDTGAYFAGRSFGKTKLAPRVSPSKTVEGAIGGLLGGLTGGLAAHFVFLPQVPLLDACLLALIGGALGQLGDLLESLIKRSVGAKDSGALLPGHGGMLDRVDALMFTATACLLYATWILPYR